MQQYSQMTDKMLFWAQQSAAVSPVRSQRAFVHHIIKRLVALNKSFPPRRQTLQPGVRLHDAKATTTGGDFSCILFHWGNKWAIQSLGMMWRKTLLLKVFKARKNWYTLHGCSFKRVICRLNVHLQNWSWRSTNTANREHNWSLFVEARSFTSHKIKT